MSNEIISDDLQASFITDPLVILYELNLNSTFEAPVQASGESSGDYNARVAAYNEKVLRFHPGLDGELDELKFHRIGVPAENTDSDALTYAALPLIMDGVEHQSDGAMARPTLTIANVTNIFNSALDDEDFEINDLIGQRITRRRTFANYLVGGADDGTPYELPIQTYVIERVATRDNTSVVLELSAPFDLANVKLPGRVVIGKYCPWIYQGEALQKGGGCRWLLNNEITYKTRKHAVYVNKDDKRMTSQTILNAESSSYDSATTYAKSDIVSYSSKYYQSILDSNTDKTPTSFIGVWWEEVIPFDTYSVSTAYTVGKHVIYDNKIWKCILAGTGKTPVMGSHYWNREDLCSKTLTGCKRRYQAIPTSDADNKPMSQDLKTDRILPFGGFPGSAKFS